MHPVCLLSYQFWQVILFLKSEIGVLFFSAGCRGAEAGAKFEVLLGMDR